MCAHSQGAWGPSKAGVCLHTALKCQSTGKGSSAQEGVQRQKDVPCRGWSRSGTAVHSTGDEAAPSLWLQHPGGAVCCTELDSPSVGTSSFLPGQCCNHITPSCLTLFCHQSLREVPAYQSSVQILCLVLQLLFPNISFTALVCRVNITTCTHSHTWAPAKRHSGLSFIAQDVSMVTTFTSHHWLWKAGHQQLQVS